MRYAQFCLLGALTSAVACGGIDNAAVDSVSGEADLPMPRTKGSGAARERASKLGRSTAGANTAATALTASHSAGAQLGNELAAEAPQDLTPELWIAPNHPCYEWDALPPAQVPWRHITHLGLGYLQPE